MRTALSNLFRINNKKFEVQLRFSIVRKQTTSINLP